MRINVYIDGFNLYYRALRNTPFRWLNVAKLCQLLFPRDEIQQINYFTAKVKPLPHDVNQPLRQQVYLRALKTLPNVQIECGYFLVNFVPMAVKGTSPPKYITVVKPEEKGSDVNLACALLMDAFDDKYDLAAILSTDSDLVKPIHIVRQRFGKKVGLCIPHRARARALIDNVDFVKHIRRGALKDSQFSTTLRDEKGEFHKPESW